VKAPAVASTAVRRNISTGTIARRPRASRSAQAARRSIVPVSRTIENSSVAPTRMKNRLPGNCAITTSTSRPASRTPTPKAATMAMSPALTAVSEPHRNAATRTRKAMTDKDIVVSGGRGSAGGR
jgi:electron transfer flavoprotein alpha subunit